MRFSEIIKSSFTTLKMNGRRTFLTMFGIIIGIAAVITIMSLGKGFEKSTLENLAKDDQGRISQVFFFRETNFTNRPLNPFSNDNLAYIRQLPGVLDVQRTIDDVKTIHVEIKMNRNDEEDFVAVGIQETTEFGLVAGRNLTADDSRAKRSYVVVDETWSARYFNTPQAALNQTVKIQDNYYTIVGVYQAGSAKDVNEQDVGVFNLPGDEPMVVMPKGAYSRTQTGSGTQYTIKVFYPNDYDMKATNHQIKQYLNEHGRERSNGAYDFFDSSEMMASIGQTLRMVTYFISAVAALSLFIAGVGVMNMMYISVSERTKEIGIRRALGATKRAIQWQFLLEGIAITTFGGVIGYLLGYGLCLIIGRLLPFKPYTDIKTALVCVLISGTIGILFSVFPSRQAAQKNVVEILR